MNQYELQNAAEKIDGYYIDGPRHSPAFTFDKAKAECIQNMRRALANVEALTHEQFRAGTKRPKLAAHAA